MQPGSHLFLNAENAKTHLFWKRTKIESTPKSTPYETDSVALEEQLGDSRITRKGDPYAKVTPSSLKMVAPGRKHSSKPTITSPQSCCANLYRHIERRAERSLGETHCKGNLVLPECKLHINYPELKVVFMA